MPMLGPGTHQVRVTNVGFSDPAGGIPQLSIRFEDEMGEGISWYHALGFIKGGGFSAKSFKFAQDSIRNLGVEIDYDTDFAALGQPDASPLMNRQCEIVVVEEEYEGQVRTKVKWINDPGRAPGMERMEPEAAKSFNDRMRQALRGAGVARGSAAKKPAAPPARAPAQQPKNPPQSDVDFDDIPF